MCLNFRRHFPETRRSSRRTADAPEFPVVVSGAASHALLCLSSPGSPGCQSEDRDQHTLVMKKLRPRNVIGWRAAGLGRGPASSWPKQEYPSASGSGRLQVSLFPKKKIIILLFMCLGVLPAPHIYLELAEARRGCWTLWNWSYRWL